MSDAATPPEIPLQPTPGVTPAGWYANPQSQSTWWTGTEWGAPPAAAVKAPKPPVRVPRWAATAVPIAALVLGLIIGGAGKGGNSSELTALQEKLDVTQSQLETVQRTTGDMDDREKDVTARENAVADREAAVTTVEATIAANTIPGDGAYLVNAQIAPGIYQSVDNSGCYWERDSGLSGTLGDIIANDNVDGQAIVEIAASDVAFQTSRCNDWVKVG